MVSDLISLIGEFESLFFVFTVFLLFAYMIYYSWNHCNAFISKKGD